MNSNTQRLFGLFLLITGVVFYLQQAFFADYLFAHRNDFAHLYLAGYLADRGGHFFDSDLLIKAKLALQIPTGLNPFVYPPFFAVLLRPLSWFSYDWAWNLFTLLSHAAYFAALALLIHLFRREHESTLLWWGTLLALSAFYDPLHRTFAAGQVNTFLLLLFCLGWYFIRTNHITWAGILFGLGASIKVSPAFLLLYLGWKGQWSGLFAGIVTIVGTTALSWAILGMDVHFSFVHEAQQMSYGESTWAHLGMHYHVEPHNQAPSALWYRLFTSNPATQGLLHSPLFARFLSWFSAALLISLLLWFTPRGKSSPVAMEYSLWLLALLLLPSLLWDHYLVQVLFIYTFGFRLILDGTRKYPAAAFLAFALTAVPYPFSLQAFSQGWYIWLASIKLYGIILLLMFLLLNWQVAEPLNKSDADRHMEME
jgi:hypothetical protein